jgi:hypothetical protein
VSKLEKLCHIHCTRSYQRVLSMLHIPFCWLMMVVFVLAQPHRRRTLHGRVKRVVCPLSHDSWRSMITLRIASIDILGFDHLTIFVQNIYSEHTYRDTQNTYRCAYIYIYCIYYVYLFVCMYVCVYIHLYIHTRCICAQVFATVYTS